MSVVHYWDACNLHSCPKKAQRRNTDLEDAGVLCSFGTCAFRCCLLLSTQHEVCQLLQHANECLPLCIVQDLHLHLYLQPTHCIH